MSECTGPYKVVGSYAYLGNSGGCGCSCTPDPCEATPITSTDYIVYNAADLPCTGIVACDTMTISLQKIDEKICELFALLVPTTTTSSTSTTSSTTTTTTTIVVTNCTLTGIIQC